MKLIVRAAVVLALFTVLGWSVLYVLAFVVLCGFVSAGWEKE